MQTIRRTYPVAAAGRGMVVVFEGDARFYCLDPERQAMEAFRSGHEARLRLVETCRNSKEIDDEG